MANDERPNLDRSLTALNNLARKLIDHAKTINDPEQDSYVREVEKFAKISMELSTYKSDDIRENIISTYNLVSRPQFEDSDVNFSHLLLDKLVNDVRDALLEAELSAASDGAPPPSQMNPSQSSVLIPSSIEASELREIEAKVSNIQSEISAIRVSGTQVGLLNIQLEKMEIRLHLAEAIIEMKRWIDGLNLQKNISGLKMAARQAQGWLQDKLTPAMTVVGKSIDAIVDASSSALRMVASLVEKYQKPGDDSDAIWSESEISALLQEGRPVPEAAAPFVRSLSLASGYRSTVDLDLREVGKLKDLRHLTINYLKQAADLDELSSLEKLRSLTILINFPANFSWINDLTKLENLSIRGINKSLSKLSFPDELYLKNLQTVSIMNCTSDAFPEFHQQNITSLDVDDFDVDDYGPIARLKNLKILSIGNNRISNFEFLRGLDELESIDIRGSSFSDISITKNLPGLKTIFINRSYFSERFRSQISKRVEIRGDHGGLIRGSRV